MTWPTGIKGGLFTVACFWAGWLLGRVTAKPPPSEVVTKTVDRVVYQDRVEYRDRVEIQQARAQVIRRVIRVTVAPDGTTTRDVTVDKATNASQSAQASAQGERTKYLAESHEVSSTTVLAPRWLLGVMGGINAGGLLGADRRWWLGGSMTHSFVGPLRWGLAVVKVKDQPIFVGGKVEVGR